MNGNGSGNARYGRTPKRTSDEIRRDIDHTRHEMDETLEELYARLHPVHLLNDLLGYASRPRNQQRLRSAASKGRFKAKRARANAEHQLHRAGHAARRTGRRTGRRAASVGQQVWREVRRHPVPALVVAAGLGLYFWQRTRERSPYLDVDIVVIGEEDFVRDGYGPSGSGMPAAHPAPAGLDRTAAAAGAGLLRSGSLDDGRVSVTGEREASQFRSPATPRPDELNRY